MWGYKKINNIEQINMIFPVFIHLKRIPSDKKMYP